VLSHVKVRAILRDLELEFDFESAPEDAGSHDKLIFAFETAERLAKRGNRRMVIMLDEFQELSVLGGETILTRLRSVLQHQQHTSHLFLGSKPTMTRGIFADRRQAFYRFALLLELPPIRDHEWREYLGRKFASLGLSVTPAAIDVLIEKTGGHPYSVMAVASSVYYMTRDKSVIHADDVFLAWEEAMEHLHPFYLGDWEAIHSNRHAPAVLEALACGRGPYSIGLHSGVVSKALRFLEHAGYVQRGARRGEYRIVEPMFVEWIRRRLSVE
jgi:AAA+ ATPase superfamily predicted ATPase